MSVLITMQVGPVDWEKFEQATAWVNGQPAPGMVSRKVYRAEDNPNMVLVIEEWDSHDAFHKATDLYGDEFNRRAGTAGNSWQDRVWTAPAR